jgi:hypothetical protein
MRTILYLFIFLLLIFSSCHRTNKGLSFDGGSFREVRLNYGDAKKYTNDSLFLGNPLELKFHPEGFIVLQEFQLQKQITVIDLETGNVQQLVSRGRGPNEMLSARNITIQDGNIWVSGQMDGKCMKLSLNRESRMFEITGIFDLLGARFTQAYPFADNMFLILSNPTSGKRMEIVDDRGETLREVGSFPDTPNNLGIVPNNAFFQSSVGISPDNKHVVAACKSVDYIDIYDGMVELQKRLHGPAGVRPIFEEVKAGGGVHFVQTPMFHAWRYISAHNDRFFVSYVGVEDRPGENKQSFADRIYSFDWKGNPQECYRFDTPLLGYDVDWVGQKLYCVTQTPESEILIFDL